MMLRRALAGGLKGETVELRVERDTTKLILSAVLQ